MSDALDRFRFCPRGHDTQLVGRAKANGGCRACRRLDPTRNTVTHERTARRRLIERRSDRKAATRRDLERIGETLAQARR